MPLLVKRATNIDFALEKTNKEGKIIIKFRGITLLGAEAKSPILLNK